MTTLIKTTFRRAALTVALVAPLCATASNAGFAYTMEAQQMCTSDAFRLCSAEIPNIPKITACMLKHRAELSAGCRSVVEREMARRSSNIAEK